MNSGLLNKCSRLSTYGRKVGHPLIATRTCNKGYGCDWCGRVNLRVFRVRLLWGVCVKGVIPAHPMHLSNENISRFHSLHIPPAKNFQAGIPQCEALPQRALYAYIRTGYREFLNADLSCPRRCVRSDAHAPPMYRNFNPCTSFWFEIDAGAGVCSPPGCTLFV